MENPFEQIIEKLNTIENLVREMYLHKYPFPESAAAQNGILNMEQAAEFLSISVSALYKHTSEKNIPFFKTGKKNYFKTSDLSEWLTKHRVMTNEDIEKAATDYIIRKGKAF